MRNMPAERGDFGNHGALISGLDRRQHGRHDDRAHHRKRRRQADLKADALRQGAVVARRDKIEIGGARLAGIAELAEAHVGGRNAFGQGQEREAIGRPDGAGRIRPQKHAGAQQRILPADPQSAAADLAVGNAAQIRAEQFSDGAENLIDSVEADTADQMNVHCGARYSAACNDGGRMVSTPSAAVAEIVVRTM